MIDIHSHILPGIDDGASDMKEALSMARMAGDDGISTMVATPHFQKGIHDNTRQRVLGEVARFREALRKEGLGLKVLPGADVGFDAGLIGSIEGGEALTLNDGGKFLLLELPAFFVPAQVKEQVYALKRMGICAIISHPERNRAVMDDLEILYGLIHMGALVQVTAASVTGRMGRRVRAWAHKLLELRMVHILATDSHNTSTRKPSLRRAVDEAAEVLGTEAAEKMVLDFPRAVLAGEMPQVWEPVKEKKRRFFGFPKSWS